MDDLIDNTVLRFNEPADVFESFGFGLIKQSKIRAPYGTWNIYQTDSIYTKIDFNGNKWSVISKDRCSESGQRITYELNGSIIYTEDLNPISIVTKVATRFQFFRPTKKADRYEIIGTEIKNNVVITESLNLLKEEYIVIKNSGNQIEFHCLIEEFETEKIKTFITILEQLLNLN